MKAIKRWRDISAVLFVVCMFITGLFINAKMLWFSMLFCIADCALLVLVYTRNRLYHDADLICNNYILCVPSAIITVKGCSDKIILCEIVVSTFGLLIGNNMFKWGSDGAKGTRLKQAALDKELLWLTFGTEQEVHCIELLHGMTKSIIEITQKLQHETGVSATITGW